MNIKKIMLSGLLAAIAAQGPAIAKSSPRVGKISSTYETAKEKLASAYRTFKKDMKCMFELNCTPEQRNRIIKEGLVLSGLLAGGRIFWMLRQPSRQPSWKELVEQVASIMKDIKDISDDKGTVTPWHKPAELLGAARDFSKDNAIALDYEKIADKLYNSGYEDDAIDAMSTALKYAKRAKQARERLEKLKAEQEKQEDF